MSLNIRTPDPNQGKVYDVADPNRRARSPGPASNSLKFDSMTARNVLFPMFTRTRSPMMGLAN